MAWPTGEKGRKGTDVKMNTSSRRRTNTPTRGPHAEAPRKEEHETLGKPKHERDIASTVGDALTQTVSEYKIWIEPVWQVILFHTNKPPDL